MLFLLGWCSHPHINQGVRGLLQGRPKTLHWIWQQGSYHVRKVLESLMCT